MIPVYAEMGTVNTVVVTPSAALPAALRDSNPRRVPRRVDGVAE